ncbi:hypothetical protein DL93DRAFT_1611668 [Clavulina sp. PMI_390]|nr:hypothetical protein DL93DRAFT_1611668 [Clavulina sp. PMI_390]
MSAQASNIVEGKSVRHEQYTRRHILRLFTPSVFAGMRSDVLHEPMDDATSKSIKLSELPEDVIVAILSQSLSPWDLVAVSHTCHSLRACSNVRAVWASAWARSRGDNSLRWIPPANLNLPRQLSRDESEPNGIDDVEPSNPQTTSAPSSSSDPHHELSEPTASPHQPSAGLSDYAAHFWKTLRIRHGMRQPKAIIRPALESMIIEYQPKSMSWKLLPDGNFALAWALDTRTADIYDFRLQLKHNITLPIAFTIGALDGDVVRYKDRDGILLIVNARRTK